MTPSTESNDDHGRSLVLQKALDDLKQMQSQLLQSEKLASIGELAAGVAHEINNPIGFVKSNLGTMDGYRKDLTRLVQSYDALESELMHSDIINDLPSIQKAIDHIRQIKADIDLEFIMDDYPGLIEESKEGMARVSRIVADLKDFAHPSKVKAEYADLNQGISTTLNLVWNELKYKAEVIKDLGELPLILCYPQQLNQVFANLLINSAHAIKAAGVINIITRFEKGRVKIQFSDNGCGIPDEIIPKIYDPFFTTKAVGKGTGLGLNVVYNIIKTHKGEIDLKTQVGKGTTFTITLDVDPDIDQQA